MIKFELVLATFPRIPIWHPPERKVTSTNAPQPHPDLFEMFLVLAFLIMRTY